MLVTVSETNFPVIQDIISNRGTQSVGICYLPSSQKASYFYLYIPSLNEKAVNKPVINAVHTADIQIHIEEESNHEGSGLFVQKRVRLIAGQLLSCHVTSENLDKNFAARLFISLTNCV
jgi:hypothetical protein